MSHHPSLAHPHLILLLPPLLALMPAPYSPHSLQVMSLFFFLADAFDARTAFSFLKAVSGRLQAAAGLTRGGLQG